MTILGSTAEDAHTPLQHTTRWTRYALTTCRDKGLARLYAAAYGGDASVQRVRGTSAHHTKNFGAWHAWVDPQDPPPGIMRRTLRRILTRRLNFGGRKGRRAAKRLKEMTR